MWWKYKIDVYSNILYDKNVHGNSILCWPSRVLASKKVLRNLKASQLRNLRFRLFMTNFAIIISIMEFPIEEGLAYDIKIQFLWMAAQSTLFHSIYRTTTQHICVTTCMCNATNTPMSHALLSCPLRLCDVYWWRRSWSCLNLCKAASVWYCVWLNFLGLYFL